MSTAENRKTSNEDDIGSACAGPPCGSLHVASSEDATEILGAADTYSGATGSERERRSIARSQNHDLTVPTNPTHADGRDGEATASTAAPASAPGVVGQYDFNKLSGIRLRKTAPSDATICLRDDSEAVPSDSAIRLRDDREAVAIRLRDGPDADTAPTTVTTPSARAPELVVQHNFNKLSPESIESSESPPHTTSEHLVSTLRNLDNAEALYRDMVPGQDMSAMDLELRLAQIDIMRRHVQLQDEQENGSAPPPYDPSWRDTSHATGNSVVGPAIPLSAPPSQVATSMPAKPRHHKFAYDLRVYSDPDALQAYNRARNEDFQRYREAHGLTTIRGRIASWWKNLYGGLSFDELIE
ncbi:hypothetical protein CALVIDRAFT_559437 [Calocera viscosa TUFC12733]|uniref:Uncharacterized protein n=1 Tax=Calocera viscosa (strain TUFC12733) TaxID=1330018 RepID=A0A167S713_CALVF|nr:hypothetical protein CALVIDRAFT_559437 [Calocera viscosa TUFC12733]